MPKVATILTNFTGGELSPALGGRVDVAKYNSGVARMENFYPRVQGGAVGRAGSRDLGQAKADARLISFVYSRSLSYQLEMGAGYLRVWRMDGSRVLNGTAPLELVTPYSAEEVAAVKYEQGDDTMFLLHQDHPVQRLQRYADTIWRIGATPWVNEPTSERGEFPPAAATLSAASVGAGRTLIAATATFLASDIGREVRFGLGHGLITAVTSATVAVITIDAAFDSTTLAGGAWLLDGSPQALIYVSAKDPAGAIVTIVGAPARAAAISLGDFSDGSAVVTATAGVFAAGDVGRSLYADAGVATITEVGDPTHATILKVSAADFLSKSYPQGSWGVAGAVFRSSDVGRVLKANGTGGRYVITAFQDPTTVSAEIRTAASALVSSPVNAWALQSSDWTPRSGYPRAAALHEQRLWLAGSNDDPRTVWASRIGEYLDIEPGLNDDAGFTYALNVRQRNPIVHLVSARRLFALTTGLEVSLKGGNEKAIGPTSIQATTETAEGTSQIRPLNVGTEVLFVQGAGRKLHALGYSAAIDGFDSPDRTVFADHITTSGLRDLAFAAQPDTLLFASRNDGQMAVCAYSVAQEVIGWSRFVTDGAYRSVSVIPREDRDDVWAIVDRGAAGFRVERFELELKTDCARTATGAATTAWSGFEHLAGRTVFVLADGVNQGMMPVSSAGQITLARAATSIEAGLPFVPVLELLPPEIGGGGSTVQGSNLSVHEVTVRLLATESLEINGNLSDFRRFGAALLDQAPPSYSGDFRSFTLADNVYRPKIVVRQPLPYPVHVLAIVRKCTVNDT